MATFACVHTSLATPFITSPSTSNILHQHQNDSDCGSSSGIGGMRTQDVSDEGASSSSSHPVQSNEFEIPPSSLSTEVPPKPKIINNNSNKFKQFQTPIMPTKPLFAQPTTSTSTPTQLPHISGVTGTVTTMMNNTVHQPPLPPPLPVAMSTVYAQIPQTTIPPPNIAGALQWMGQPPHAPNNYIFVHVQVGETLTLFSNGETQTINGPASIRMIGEHGAFQLPLPIALPLGHQCHQFVDELGILRHIVLSLEPTGAKTPYPREMNVPHMIGPQITVPVTNYPPMVAQSSKVSALNGTIALPVTPITKPPPVPPLALPALPGKTWSAKQDEHFYQEPEIDPEENEKIREMLNRIMTPSVLRVLTTEVDIAWQHIDTSEACAPGGPFPQIDASEFTYHATIYENNGRFVATYTLDQTCFDNPAMRQFNPENTEKVRIGNLRPFTDYSVQIKASLEERGIYGDPSQQLFFRTAPGRPEAPLNPKVIVRGSDFVHVTWRPAVNNGAAVNLYYVYVNQLNQECGTQMLQFGTTEGKITNLKPATTYRLRITSVNALGESFDATSIEATTKTDGPPPQPLPPMFVNATHRSIRLQWQPIPECTYALEMFDVERKTVQVIRDRLTGTSIQVSDLRSNSEYQFRLFAKNQDGESPRSDWTSVRTNHFRVHNNHHNHYQHNANNYSHPPPNMQHINMQQNQQNNLEMPPRVPTTPMFIKYVNKKPEVGWKCYGAKDQIYNLEGSSQNQPNKYRSIYRGSSTSYVINDDDVQFVRVQSVSKRNNHSEFSDRFQVPRLESERQAMKPEKIPAPEMTNKEKGQVLIKWRVATSKQRHKTSLIYNLQRMDLKEGATMIYTGGATQYTLENVPAETRVVVRVRAVIACNDFNSNGDWSEYASITVPRLLPPCPQNLCYSDQRSLINWDCDEPEKILHYKVVVVNKDLNQLINDDEVKEQVFNVCHLKPGVMHQVSVKSVNENGICPESAVLQFRTIALVPSQPEAVTISNMGTDRLKIQWTCAESNGAAIRSYRIILHQGQSMVKEAAFIPGENVENEYVFTNLEQDTLYRVEIYAENIVGRGQSVLINGKTKPLPPVAPRLTCETFSNCLRISWKNSNPNIPMMFKLVRFNKNDQQLPVYEGENTTIKVKNLVQDTNYTFQIRASNRNTGSTIWSEPYTFRTTLGPPPQIRYAPIITPNAVLSRHYNVEWSNVLPAMCSRKQLYRLQVVEANFDESRWHTVYEGLTPSFQLKTTNYKGAINVRVMCVRKEQNETEVRGEASPIAYISNESINQNGIEKKGINDNDDKPSMWKNLLNRSLVPLLFVLGCIIITLFLATICDWLFSLTQGTGTLPPIPKSSQQSAYTPSPPSIPSKMVNLPTANHRDL